MTNINVFCIYVNTVICLVIFFPLTLEQRLVLQFIRRNIT